MGSLCSKGSKDDNFANAGPGRPLGSSAAPPPNRSSIPPGVQPQQPTGSTAVKGPGRALGGGGGGGGAGGADSAKADPRAAAARAAEERAHKNHVSSGNAHGKGKLARQLEAQKRQTQPATLEQISRENRLARDADQNAEARRWD